MCHDGSEHAHDENIIEFNLTGRKNGKNAWVAGATLTEALATADAALILLSAKHSYTDAERDAYIDGVREGFIEESVR